MKTSKPLLLASALILLTAVLMVTRAKENASPAEPNLYAGIGASHLNDAVKDHLDRIYVPNLRSSDVYVIDPAKMLVVDRFKVGIGPQHIVPSWDLQTLWVTNNA